MITLRCTASLFKQLGSRPGAESPPTGLLGDWDAKVVATRPQRLVLCTNERTLLCVVVPFAPGRELPQRFGVAAQRLIQRLPVPPALIDREVTALNEIAIGRAANRSVRSSMTHFGYAVDSWFESDGSRDLEALSLWLCDTPCFPLRTHWPWLEAELVLTGEVAPGRRPITFEEDLTSGLAGHEANPQGAMDLERVVLQYLAREEFASEFELLECMRVQGLETAVGERLLATWWERGWVERVEQGATGLPPLLHLTNRAYADQPWLARVS